jgi:anti-sigma-K factor RskA
MIDERTEEAASLYALDLLDGAEKSDFESRLRRDPSLRALVEELRVSSTALALLAPEAAPPDALRDRIMNSLPAADRPDLSSSSLQPSASTVPFPFALWTGWATAACFALATAFLASLYVGTSRDLATARDLESVARIDAESARQLLEAERLLAQAQIADLRNARVQIANLERQADVARLKISSLASLLSDSPHAQAVAVWNSEAQEGVLSVSNLPALPADRDYQLWVIDPQYPIPVDGGVFTVEPASGDAHLHFKPKEPIKDVSKFAVSLERKGGVAKAEGPMVLISP